MKLRKLLLATAGAAVLLGALVGTASARNFSTSEPSLRATFREVIFNGAFGNINCAITLEGSLHARTIAKVVNSLIGYISRVILGACREGRATVLRETLPWHIRYQSFTGALPAITQIATAVTGLSYRIQEPFAGCLATSTASSPAVLVFDRNGGNNFIDTATLGGTVQTSCGINGSFTSSRGPVTALNSVARITITLI